jgi:hypothetical protein
MSQTQRDKLYAVEIDTTSYSLILAARTEDVMMDALSAYAHWEAMTFLDSLEKYGYDGYDEPENLRSELIDLIQSGNCWSIRDMLQKHYDQFTYTFHIIHTDEPIKNLWQVRNFRYTGQAANEYIPNPMWTDAATVMRTRRMNTHAGYHAEPVFIVDNVDNLRFQLDDGSIIVTIL